MPTKNPIYREKTKFGATLLIAVVFAVGNSQASDQEGSQKPVKLTYELIKNAIGNDHISMANGLIHDVLESWNSRPIAVYSDDASNPIAFTHVWKSKGFQAMFDKDNILQFVSLHTAYDSNFEAFPFPLPAKLKPSDNQELVEKTLGKPDSVSARNKYTYYELVYKKLGLTVQFCHNKSSNADVIRSIKIYLPSK